MVLSSDLMQLVDVYVIKLNQMLRGTLIISVNSTELEFSETEINDWANETAGQTR